MLNNEPERCNAAVQETVDTNHLPARDPSLVHLEQAPGADVFRPVDFKQLYISILGLNVIDYLAGPEATTVATI